MELTLFNVNSTIPSISLNDHETTNRQTSKPEDSKPVPKVRCCNCARCTRDTSGRSISVITGEYFMGTCPLGHADGRTIINQKTNQLLGRVFINKARVCADFK